MSWDVLNSGIRCAGALAAQFQTEDHHCIAPERRSLDLASLSSLLFLRQIGSENCVLLFAAGSIAADERDLRALKGQWRAGYDGAILLALRGFGGAGGASLRSFV